MNAKTHGIRKDSDEMNKLAKRIEGIFPASKFGSESDDLNVLSLLDDLPCFESFDVKIEDHSLPAHLENVPFKCVRLDTRRLLSSRLDIESNDVTDDFLLKDWRGLAEQMNISPEAIEYIGSNRESKTVEVLEKWMKQGVPHTVGDLWHMLETIDRFDVLKSKKFHSSIVSDAQRFVDIQEEELKNPQPPPRRSLLKRMRSNSETEKKEPPAQIFLDVEEALRIRKEHHVSEKDIFVVGDKPDCLQKFDAYLSCSDKDIEFVREIIDFLERRHNMRLCIRERDLLPGKSSHFTIAELIKSRCRKMVVILSPDFLQSAECDFQFKTARALNRAQVLIMIKRCEPPPAYQFMRVLRHFEMRTEWFWDRIEQAVRSLQSDLFSRPRAEGGAGVPSEAVKNNKDDHKCTKGCSCKDRKKNLKPLPIPLLAVAYVFQGVNSIKNKAKRTCQRSTRQRRAMLEATGAEASAEQKESGDSAEGSDVEETKTEVVMEGEEEDATQDSDLQHEDDVTEPFVPEQDAEALEMSRIPLPVFEETVTMSDAGGPSLHDFSAEPTPEAAGASGGVDPMDDECENCYPPESPNTWPYQWPKIPEPRNKWSSGYSWECLRHEVLRKRFNELYRNELQKFSRRALVEATAIFEREMEIYKRQQQKRADEAQEKTS